jgi:VanZ family protein
VNLLTAPAAAAVLACAAVLVAGVLLVRTVRAAGTGRRGPVALARLAWVGFVLVVVWLTVSLDLGAEGGVNLVPFATVRLQLEGLEPVRAAWNLLGNLVLLVPFALLARAAWGWRVVATTVAGGALSVAVEVGQYFSGRSADVDDVMVNGLGALLGAVLAAVVVRLVRRDEGTPRHDGSPWSGPSGPGSSGAGPSGAGPSGAGPSGPGPSEPALSGPTPRSAGSP